jgi:hypothetical protein
MSSDGEQQDWTVWERGRLVAFLLVAAITCLNGMGLRRASLSGGTA